MTEKIMENFFIGEPSLKSIAVMVVCLFIICAIADMWMARSDRRKSRKEHIEWLREFRKSPNYKPLIMSRYRRERRQALRDNNRRSA